MENSHWYFCPAWGNSTSQQLSQTWSRHLGRITHISWATLPKTSIPGEFACGNLLIFPRAADERLNYLYQYQGTIKNSRHLFCPRCLLHPGTVPGNTGMAVMVRFAGIKQSPTTANPLKSTQRSETRIALCEDTQTAAPKQIVFKSVKVQLTATYTSIWNFALQHRTDPAKESFVLLWCLRSCADIWGAPLLSL